MFVRLLAETRDAPGPKPFTFLYEGRAKVA